MTFVRSAIFSPLVFAAVFAALPSSVSAQTRPSSALTFDVSARVATGSGGPQQTFNARVSISGAKARVETGSGAQRAVMLWNAPYLYRLLPSSKVGVRWNVGNSSPGGFKFGGFDPQQLLRDPSKLRAALVQNGAKRVKSETFGGALVDVFQLSAPKGRLQKAKAWLRRSDALPVRLEASGGGASLVASWSSYARPKTLAASLFSPPPGFKIRQATSAPPVAGL